MKIFYSKQKFIYIIFFTIFLFSSFVIIANYSHKQPIILDIVGEIIFSHESGFYDKDFYLTIFSRGDVYYTLDGSDPSNKSIHYTNPIHITDASNNANVYSMRDDTTPGFKEELIRNYSKSFPHYKVPNYLIDKCTIVRAVIYYGNGSYSNIKNASFFVGYENKRGYNTNVCSLITDPKNLFDYEKGIMVLGKTFDDFVQNTLENKDKGKNWYGINWWNWRANYSKGIAFEKDAICQFFQNQKFVLSQNCGINIRGEASRGFIQKSFNLYTRKKYGKNSHFAYNFFGNKYFPKCITLFSGGQDYNCKIKDFLINSLCINLDFSTMKFCPYVLFIDGEYWGHYWLTEKYDKHFIYYYYKVLPDNVIMVKNGILEEGIEEDIFLYNKTIDYIIKTDFSFCENYEQLKVLIDIDSFIDYYAVGIYIARRYGWNYNENSAIWRSKKIGENGYNDGRWRWMFFDVNNSGQTDDLICFDSFNHCLNTDPVFCSIMKNKELKNKLLNKLIELKNTTFSNDNVGKIMELFHTTMDEPMKLNCRRFFGDNQYSRYLNSVNSVVKFFQNRPEYIDKMVEKYR